MTKAFAIGASLLSLAVAAPANAAFVLQNSIDSEGSAANGFVTITQSKPLEFTLFGSDSDTLAGARTTYTDVARSARAITFSYSYATADDFGSSFDVAGFVVNGLFTQLSPLFPDEIFPGDVASGRGSFLVNQGDRFGFYVETDGVGNTGRGSLAISQLGVPEPATWAMMILGFGFIGGAMRYARRSTKVAFA